MTPQLTVYHLLVTGVGGMAATLGTVWTVFVRPAQRKEIRLEVRLADIEGKLREGEKAFQRHQDRDDRLEGKIDKLIDSVNQLKQQFSAVGPALNRELGQ